MDLSVEVVINLDQELRDEILFINLDSFNYSTFKDKGVKAYFKLLSKSLFLGINY